MSLIPIIVPEVGKRPVKPKDGFKKIYYYNGDLLMMDSDGNEKSLLGIPEEYATYLSELLNNNFIHTSSLTNEEIYNGNSSLLVTKSYIDLMFLTIITDYDGDIEGLRDEENTIFKLRNDYVRGTTRVYLNGQRLFHGDGYDYLETDESFPENSKTLILSEPLFSDDRITIDYRRKLQF